MISFSCSMKLSPLIQMQITFVMDIVYNKCFFISFSVFSLLLFICKMYINKYLHSSKLITGTLIPASAHKFGNMHLSFFLFLQNKTGCLLMFSSHRVITLFIVFYSDVPFSLSSVFISSLFISSMCLYKRQSIFLHCVIDS